MKFAGFFHAGPVTVLCQMTNILICIRQFRIIGIFSLHISVYEKSICMYHFRNQPDRIFAPLYFYRLQAQINILFQLFTLDGGP